MELSYPIKTIFRSRLVGMARPKKKISEFDVRLGKVVKSKRVKASHTRESFAQVTGIAEANLKRREEGQNEITVSELQRIARAVNVSPQALVEEALDDYGGIEKLRAEHAPTSEVVGTVTAEDEVEYIGNVPARYDLAADENARK